jgi:5-methylcytosine-specific restriction endonuclease McrA
MRCLWPGCSVLSRTSYCPAHQPTYQTREWQAKRQRVMVRDGNRCAVCGRTGGRLELDHRVPRGSGGSDDERNLRLVCVGYNRGGVRCG